MKRQAAQDCNDKEPSKNAMVTPRTQLVFDTAGAQHLCHSNARQRVLNAVPADANANASLFVAEIAAPRISAT
jgi:hypothetical protein